MVNTIKHKKEDKEHHSEVAHANPSPELINCRLKITVQVVLFGSSVTVSFSQGV